MIFIQIKLKCLIRISSAYSLKLSLKLKFYFAFPEVTSLKDCLFETSESSKVYFFKLKWSFFLILLWRMNILKYHYVSRSPDLVQVFLYLPWQPGPSGSIELFCFRLSPRYVPFCLKQLSHITSTCLPLFASS